MSSLTIPQQVVRPCAVRRGWRWRAGAALVLGFCTFAYASPGLAQSAVRGEASISTTGGYGRLVIRLAADIEAQPRISGGVLVIQFKQPVDVPVDRLAAGARSYIGAARRDPDGRALRFALAQKVRISSMTAGNRLFIDLLPESWTGDPPGLPREVVEELARRARDADRAARVKAEAERQSRLPPVRVRVAQQPTFTRYIFELPDLTAVTADRGKDRLTLSFASALRFDLAEAKLALPDSVGGLDAASAGDTATVQFAFAGAVDVRTFREDANFVVDVSPLDGRAARGGPALLPGLSPPPTVAAKPEPVLPKQAPAAKTEEAPSQPAAAPETPKAQARGQRRDPNQPVSVELRRQGENLRLFFPFATPTPAAVFQRADTLWLVFDTKVRIDTSMLSHDSSRVIRGATLAQEGEAQVVRVKLERPRLVSAELDELGWAVTIGESIQGASKPLLLARNIVGPGRTSVTIPFDEPHKAHWLKDDEIGDVVLAVTGLGPARGLLRSQDFVEFRALATAQGVAVQPFADDLKVELSSDKVLLLRPEGLTLSEPAVAAKAVQPMRAVTFDTAQWSAEREADFTKRQFELVGAAAASGFTQRSWHRLALARFYLAREMYAEAKSVLDATIADERPTAEDPSALVLRAVASTMLGRADEALKDLADPAVGHQNDARLWRAMAYARQGKWADARDAFRDVEGALSALPLELQRPVLKEALRAAIEIGDFTGATNRVNDFRTIGVSKALEADIAVLMGRLAEGLGRKQDALAAYRMAMATGHTPGGAQGRLREITLRYSLGEIGKADFISGLETLATSWRGDDTEAETLQLMARFYTEEGRYRDTFHAMRVALTVFPNSQVTRNIHDEAAKTFDTLFLAGKADALPAIDALSLFYDFRTLTPMGRRGDEMIRRLAERLVSVDLLDQAADLLQYQVDNRLQGAARAQVAMRLAVINMLNRKPERAQAVLRATRTADLADEVRIPRLLIEARALADLGRHDFALEVIDGIEGREAVRLRADIHWAARHWQMAAEHIELMHGDRYKSFEPLNESERSDIMRAGVGYALAEDRIGVARLREKYSAKMAEGADQRAFDLVTSGAGSNSAAFREVARLVASVDTLAGFLRDLKARYPEMHSLAPDAKSPAEAQPPAPKADAAPTGAMRELRNRLSRR